MKHYNVVAAIIVRDGKVLCVQKGINKYTYTSYKYEFPGGKIESGESEVRALTREILEELSIEITVERKLITVDHEYPDFAITLHAFLCSSNAQNIILTEHVDHKWLCTNDLKNLDWAEADLPIVKKLENDFT